MAQNTEGVCLCSPALEPELCVWPWAALSLPTPHFELQLGQDWRLKVQASPPPLVIPTLSS